MYQYFAYGLNISSEIELNELIPKDFSEDADVVVRLGEVLEQITGPDWHCAWWQANDDYLLCDYTDIMRGLVSRNGKDVQIQVFTQDDFQLRSFIYGQIFSAILLLRGYFLLHGACVKIGDKALGFCGPSGVGKSTLALGFMQAGYKVYSDDVIALKIEEEKLMMYPGFPRLRIAEQLLLDLDLDTDDWEDIQHFPGKKTYLGVHLFDTDPILLENLVILRPDIKEDVQWSNVSGWEKIQLIEEGTYRQEIESWVFCEEQLLFRRTNVVNRLQIHRMQRPSQYFLLDEVLRTTLSRFRQS